MQPIRLVSNKVFIFSVFFAVLLNKAVYGQEDTTKFRGFAFLEEVTFLNADMSKTNNEIIALGYPKIDNILVGVSLGGYSHPIGKDSYLIAKFSLYFSESPRDQFQAKSADLKRFDYQIQWNYDLVKSHKWLVYPYWGFGYGFSRLVLMDGINRPFNASLVNPPKEIRTYDKTDLFGSTGLGVERRFRFNFGMDLYLGLVAGYRFSQNFSSSTTSFPASFGGVESNFRIRMETWKKILPQKPRERFKRFQ